jgi:hypothetical protein
MSNIDYNSPQQLLVIKRQNVGKIKAENSAIIKVNMLGGKFKSELSAQIMSVLACFEGRFT